MKQRSTSLISLFIGQEAKLNFPSKYYDCSERDSHSFQKSEKISHPSLNLTAIILMEITDVADFYKLNIKNTFQTDVLGSSDINKNHVQSRRQIHIQIDFFVISLSVSF